MGPVRCDRGAEALQADHDGLQLLRHRHRGAARRVMAVASGVHETVLAVGFDKPKDRGVAGPSVNIRGVRDLPETPAGWFALCAAPYFARFGAGREDLARIAVKNHHNGTLAPKSLPEEGDQRRGGAGRAHDRVALRALRLRRADRRRGRRDRHAARSRAATTTTAPWWCARWRAPRRRIRTPTRRTTSCAGSRPSRRPRRPTRIAGISDPMQRDRRRAAARLLHAHRAADATRISVLSPRARRASTLPPAPSRSAASCR